MKSILGVLCLVAAVYGAAYVPIDSIEGEAYEILDSVIPVIQTDASEFGQLVQQFNDASTPYEQLELVPKIISNYKKSYSVFGQQFAQIAQFTAKAVTNAKNASDNQIVAPQALVNDFIGGVDRVDQYIHWIDADLEVLINIFNNIITMYPSFTVQNGSRLVPTTIVNQVVDIINKISDVNELITDETQKAVATADSDLSQYIAGTKHLSPSMGLLTEVIKVIGTYIGQLTDVISQKISTLTTDLPITSVNSQDDEINTEQLIAKLDTFFQTCKNIYSSLSTVLTAANEVLPIGIAALSALN